MSQINPVAIERSITQYQYELYCAIDELNRMQVITNAGNEDYQISGMEGIFSRIFQAYANVFREIRNIFILVTNCGIFLINKNWEKIITEYVDRLRKNPMSDEWFHSLYFSVIPVNIATRNLSCISQVGNLINHMIQIACDKSDQIITQDIKRTISALEACDCKVNIQSANKSSTPSSWHMSHKTAISDMGYGDNLSKFLSGVSQIIPKYKAAYVAVGNKDLIDKNTNKINEYAVSEAKKRPDKAKETSRIILGRLEAIAACIKCASELWAKTLDGNLISPVMLAGFACGMQDDIRSFILSRLLKKKEKK